MSELERLRILRLSKEPVEIFLNNFDRNCRIVRENLEFYLEKIDKFAGFYRISRDYMIREEQDIRKEYIVAEIVLPQVSPKEAGLAGLKPCTLFGVNIPESEGNLSVRIRYQGGCELGEICHINEEIYSFKRVLLQPTDSRITSSAQTRPVLS